MRSQTLFFSNLTMDSRKIIAEMEKEFHVTGGGASHFSSGSASHYSSGSASHYSSESAFSSGGSFHPIGHVDRQVTVTKTVVGGHGGGFIADDIDTVMHPGHMHISDAHFGHVG